MFRMTETFISHNNIISPLGFSSVEVVDAIENNRTGLACYENFQNINYNIIAAIIEDDLLRKHFDKPSSEEQFTKLEKAMIASVQSVLDQSQIEITERVGLIVSTTKGNIEILENNSGFSQERTYLWRLGEILKEQLGFKNDAIILSNACISGLASVLVAKRLIEQSVYDDVIIVAGDVVSSFVITGFNSFQALSNSICRPYSKDRDGINLGEAACSVLITSDKGKLANESLEIVSGSSINDANHISGPSRTGEGLYRSVKNALKAADNKINSVDFISAHGTATEYNDEMEAIAFNRLDLQHVPLNSLKGYFGHTLGASGLLETIVGMHSLYRNTLYKTHGFGLMGLSKSLNVITETRKKNINTMLKTSSGFGGCNAAVIFKKTYQNDAN